MELELSQTGTVHNDCRYYYLHIKNLKSERILTLEVGEGLGLLMVLCGDDQRVEEYHQEDEPVEEFGFHPDTALPPEEPIPATSMASEENIAFIPVRNNENQNISQYFTSRKWIQ